MTTENTRQLQLPYDLFEIEQTREPAKVELPAIQETPYADIAAASKSLRSRILSVTSSADPDGQDLEDARYLLQANPDFHHVFSEYLRGSVPFEAVLEGCKEVIAYALKPPEYQAIVSLEQAWEDSDYIEALTYLVDEAKACPLNSVLVLHPETRRAFGYINLLEDLYTPTPLPRELGEDLPLVWVKPEGLRILPQIEAQFTVFLFDSGRDTRISQLIVAKGARIKANSRLVNQALAMATSAGRRGLTERLKGRRLVSLLESHRNTVTQGVLEQVAYIYDDSQPLLPGFLDTGLEPVGEPITLECTWKFSVIDPLAWNLHATKDPEPSLTISLAQELSRVLDQHAAPGVSLVVKVLEPVETESSDLFDTWYVQAKVPVQIYATKLLETA